MSASSPKHRCFLAAQTAVIGLLALLPAAELPRWLVVLFALSVAWQLCQEVISLVSSNG